MIRLQLRPVFSVVTGEVQVAGIGVTYPAARRGPA